MADETPERVGRPSLYRPEYAEQAEKRCEAGATDLELADFFEVSVRTIHNWKAEHPEFLHALRVGKAAADDRIERSLFNRAAGYSFDSEKVFQFQGEVVRAAIREHVPPDTAAAIFWLKNRRRDAWRDKQDHEHSGPDGGAIQIERIERTIVHPENTNSGSVRAAAETG